MPLSIKKRHYEHDWNSDLQKHYESQLIKDFRVGYFLESRSLIQERTVELLQNLCADVAVYLLESCSLIQEITVELLQNLCADEAVERTWSEKGLRTTNILLVDLEA